MTNRRDFLKGCTALAAGAATAGPALAQATTLEGVDVSHWQGPINWASVAASGISFAFCKATDGATTVDQTFATNYAGMKANNIVRGAYHYGRPAQDPIAQ